MKELLVNKCQEAVGADLSRPPPIYRLLSRAGKWLRLADKSAVGAINRPLLVRLASFDRLASIQMASEVISPAPNEARRTTTVG